MEDKMKNLGTPALVLCLLLAACADKIDEADSTTDNVADLTPAVAHQTVASDEANPFFMDYGTDFGLPPFDRINDGHFAPAFQRAIEEARAEVQAIANNHEQPTFENTVVALEYSGALLFKVSNVFFNLAGSFGADTNQVLADVAKEVEPKLSELNDDINLNPKLFERVKSIYQNRDALQLRGDQQKLLTDLYQGFVRGGANLDEVGKAELRALNTELTRLSLAFGDNLLAETNDFELIIENEADLAGLPAYLVSAAAMEATNRGRAGKWVFTTHRPSKTPFLTFSENRQLREVMWKAYTHRGDNDNANDNKTTLAEMASLRVRKAQLLGYPTYAHLVLEKNTAKNPENIYVLLDQIWPAGLAQAKNELADMQALSDAEGGDYTVQAWDWRFLAAKIRKQRYDLDEEQTRPYFSLDSTLKGVFYTVNKLYGLSFKERHDLPVYQEDVRVFEVYDDQGELLGIYLTDFYVRKSKRGGAWMRPYRPQYLRLEGEPVLPIIVNVLNYPPPVGDEPTLLTFDQASTLFHEFGHALHGFLSDIVYPSQSGIQVAWDFGEFPSQVLENWMYEPDVLKEFARHYKTGEIIPQQLVNKIQAAAQFNQGFSTTEYMAAALLDLAWHTLEDSSVKDAREFEAQVLAEIGLIDQIAPRYRSTYFSHIFSGGYAASYYGYIWSETLAADAFSVFKDKGIFDQATAEAFRRSVLSKGGSDDPMDMYREFRGQDAEVRHLLKARGLSESQ
jgi:peptidyl-dipeptidase Dcp